MHEVSLMEQTLAIAIDHARHHHASRIHHFKLRVGDLSGVVPDALSFAFEIVTQDTIAEGASLEIQKIPVTCFCHGCQQSFQPPSWVYTCPLCQELSSDIIDGQQMELTSLEIS